MAERNKEILRVLADRRCATQTSTRSAREHAVGVHHVNVLLMAAFGTFTGPRTRHQFRSWARRPELDYFAQKSLTRRTQFFNFGARLSSWAMARSRRLLSRMKPSASACRYPPACSKLAIAGSYKELADLRPTIETAPL